MEHKQTILGYLENTAKKNPQICLLQDENGNMSAGELRKKARRLAGVILRNCSSKKYQPIVVMAKKSIQAIVGFLGVAYSGNIYVPIDGAQPKERIQKIFSVLKPVAVVYDEKYKEKAFELGIKLTLPLFLTDDKEDFVKSVQDTEQNSISKLELAYSQNETIADREILKSDSYDAQIDKYLLQTIDTDPLYILFTSGSTGLPKGVTVSHKSVTDYIDWLVDTFEFDSSTVFGNQAPFYFDNSVLDIYTTLKVGAKLVLLPETYFVLPNRLVEFMKDCKVNTIFWVPSALGLFCRIQNFGKKHLPDLKKVLFCGEVMPIKTLNELKKIYPKALYANLYGPTEITDVCCYYIVDRNFSEGDNLPIGRPCKNVDIILADEMGKPVPKGEVGEILVRGTSLALGYYGDFEKTQQVFVQNPLHNHYPEKVYKTGDLARYNERGELIFIGRRDFQIKRRGHRIELGDIEATALFCENLEACCAYYSKEEEKIVLLCQSGRDKDFEADKNLKQKKLHMALSEKLPRYMLPQDIYFVEILPKTPNGKLDRKKAKQLFENGLI